MVKEDVAAEAHRRLVRLLGRKGFDEGDVAELLNETVRLFGHLLASWSRKDPEGRKAVGDLVRAVNRAREYVETSRKDGSAIGSPWPAVIRDILDGFEPRRLANMPYLERDLAAREPSARTLIVQHWRHVRFTRQGAAPLPPTDGMLALMLLAIGIRGGRGTCADAYRAELAAVKAVPREGETSTA